ncbi:MAG: hypothetical protein ABL855_01535 [Sideroxydans sp.]
MALAPYPLQSALRTHNYGSRQCRAGRRLWLLLTGRQQDVILRVLLAC